MPDSFLLITTIGGYGSLRTQGRHKSAVQSDASRRMLLTRISVPATLSARVMHRHRPSKIGGRRECRAPNSPAVSRGIKKTTRRSSPQVRRTIPAFPARRCYGLFRALPGDRAFLSPSPRNANALSRVDAGVEASGPHDFAVRLPVHSSCAPQASIASLSPTFVTIAKRSSWWARDGRKCAGDLPDIASENACGRLARRANQL